ncbi:OmpA family protein [Luteimonas sp. BDR2-5]|uniref:OmpA family protein n=1 Tax=Proluteimonas luteida TaxID=2878685 RepID=UPI001E4427E6|nr:OmpA family protein [Luteimonas sp. BDR2-5]MCD9028600.1 OmpA family protein [Luteimonas sp. BDR2-5]
MNKSVSVALPTALAAALLLGACASTPQPEPEPAPAPEPRTQVERLGADGLFAFGKAGIRDIGPEGRAELDALAARLADGRPLEVVHVIGHSDRIGNPQANLRLSNQRAEAVRSYLVERGVPAERITAVGRGDVEPIVTCDDTPRQALVACLAPNRRVEVRVQFAD